MLRSDRIPPPARAGQVAAVAAAWPAADLERRVLRAVQFASVAVADFGETGYADPVRPVLGFGPEKVVAEAAMLAYVADGVHGSGVVRDAVDALARQLEPLVRSPHALAGMARNPDQVYRRVVPHVLLTALGRPDEAFDQVAAQLSDRVLTHALDQPPTVIAERHWITRLWGRPVPGLSDPCGGTVLARPFDLLGGSREDPYGLTHLLFYVTDFGRRPAPAGRSHEAILADVEALVLRYLDHGDYDLVGELLMAWPELREAWSPAAVFAFRVLARVEDAVGVLPCGNVDPDRLARLAGQQRRRYARATSYHTALVMGFLCAVGLREGGTPPTTIVAPEYPEEAWRAFRDALEGHPGDWLPVFDDCSVAEKRALAPMLCGLVITRAMRCQDYAAMHGALEAARWFGLPTHPLHTAADDLLGALGAAARVGAMYERSS